MIPVYAPTEAPLTDLNIPFDGTCLTSATLNILPFELNVGSAFEKLPGGAVTNSTRAALDDTFGADWPNAEIFSLDGYTGSLDDFLFDNPDLKDYTSACIALVAPFSRGNVTNSSNDTSAHPIINPN